MHPILKSPVTQFSAAALSATLGLSSCTGGPTNPNQTAAQNTTAAPDKTETVVDAKTRTGAAKICKEQVSYDYIGDGTEEQKKTIQTLKEEDSSLRFYRMLNQNIIHYGKAGSETTSSYINTDGAIVTRQKPTDLKSHHEKACDDLHIETP